VLSGLFINIIFLLGSVLTRSTVSGGRCLTLLNKAAGNTNWTELWWTPLTLNIFDQASPPRPTPLVEIWPQHVDPATLKRSKSSLLATILVNLSQTISRMAWSLRSVQTKLGWCDIFSIMAPIPMTELSR